MDKKYLISFITNFKDKKIGVLGDLIFDQYILGDVEKISPEAPVPILLIEKEIFFLGGGGNTASNIAALGGKVFISGLIGKDEVGKRLIKECKKIKINTDGIIKIPGGLTIQKIRVVARGQQLVRMDKENAFNINSQIEKKIIGFVSRHIKEWDGLVISDYAKGFITKNLAQAIINLARQHKKPIIADTKPKHAHYFKNTTLIAPNHKEAREIAGTDDVKKAGKFIQKKLNCRVLITQGPQGMTLFEGSKIQQFPAKAKEVFDVTGAGDTVVAALVLSLASGANFTQAAIIANHAAGIVVGKRGTATVSIKELKNDLEAD